MSTLTTSSNCPDSRCRSLNVPLHRLRVPGAPNIALFASGSTVFCHGVASTDEDILPVDWALGLLIQVEDPATGALVAVDAVGRLVTPFTLVDQDAPPLGPTPTIESLTDDGQWIPPTGGGLPWDDAVARFVELGSSDSTGAGIMPGASEAWE